MNSYEEKLNTILQQARILASENKWEELEEFADRKQDEFLRLCGKLSKTVFNSEDDKWEAWATICGSHTFERVVSELTLIVSLNTGIKINETTVHREASS